MGIRETLNQNPAFTTGATALIILVALGIIVYQLVGGGDNTAEFTAGKAYFTIDDGKTWFADDASKLPPFEHQGKPAYLAFVYTYDGGKTKFVAYLQRYTPEAKKRIEEARAKGPAGELASVEALSGIEVKLPGTGDDPKNWVKRTDPAAAKITEIRPPPGVSPDALEQVLPQRAE
ncbi:hypothetical protein [Fontivita pretiosa]|uniref:hypothetical protein n=1 Tax=Fontivita pretiosa TaxID=2989684 RepID=UPI003D162865